MSPRLDTIKAYKRMTKRGMQFRFTREAPNGECLFTSPPYRSRQGRNAAIRRILVAEKVNVKRS
jgi:uncharacterized protein YegP (UPF0339 family)